MTHFHIWFAFKNLSTSSSAITDLVNMGISQIRAILRKQFERNISVNTFTKRVYKQCK